MRSPTVFGIIAVAAFVIGGSLFIVIPAVTPDAPASVAEVTTETDTTPTGMVAVVVPALTAQQQIGETAFNAKCAQCHGKNAAGQDGVAPPLIHRIYEPSHHGDGAFHLAVQNGVRSHHWRFGSMMPVKGLTKGDVDNIIAYVRALQKENGIF